MPCGLVHLCNGCFALFHVANLLLATVSFNIVGIAGSVIIPVAAMPLRPILGRSALVITVIRVGLTFFLLPDSLAFPLASRIRTCNLLWHSWIGLEFSTTDRALARCHGICRPRMLPTQNLQIFCWNFAIVT